MSLLPNEEIGLESHPDNDQFFRFEKGQGKCIIDDNEYLVSDGFAIIVPAGAQHNVINMSTTEDLKLYTIYSPAHHLGQILTAIGAMLHRADRRATAESATVRADLQEVREIVQSTLEKVRSLSQALHPVILDEVGFESALDLYLPGFEKQTGIQIRYEKAGDRLPIDRSVAIHLYRVVQEALNNVARHSKSAYAEVHVNFLDASIVLEVKDAGVGFRKQKRHGMGLVSMRERAELVNGIIEFLDCDGGGALVRLTVPLSPEELHAGA